MEVELIETGYRACSECGIVEQTFSSQSFTVLCVYCACDEPRPPHTIPDGWKPPKKVVN